MPAGKEGLVQGQEGGKLGWDEAVRDEGAQFSVAAAAGPSRPACSLPSAEKPMLGRDLPREMPAKRWSPVMRQ